MEQLTQSHLKELLEYTPATGVFVWAKPAGRHGRIAAGSIAGTPNKEGYRYICIEGRRYKASRLAFLYMTGEWPTNQVDHINRNTGDDRWGNLRDVSQSVNKRNCNLYKNNTTGLKGVYPRDGKYVAKIRVNGKLIHLGRFNTPEQASLAVGSV